MRRIRSMAWTKWKSEQAITKSCHVNGHGPRAHSHSLAHEIETNANIPIKQNIWFWNKFALLVCWRWLFSPHSFFVCFCQFLFFPVWSAVFCFHLPLTSNVLYLALQHPFIMLEYGAPVLTIYIVHCPHWRDEDVHTYTYIDVVHFVYCLCETVVTRLHIIAVS